MAQLPTKIPAVGQTARLPPGRAGARACGAKRQRRPDTSGARSRPHRASRFSRRPPPTPTLRPGIPPPPPPAHRHHREPPAVDPARPRQAGAGERDGAGHGADVPPHRPRRQRIQPHSAGVPAGYRRSQGGRLLPHESARPGERPDRRARGKVTGSHHLRRLEWRPVPHHRRRPIGSGLRRSHHAGGSRAGRVGQPGQLLSTPRRGRSRPCAVRAARARAAEAAAVGLVGLRDRQPHGEPPQSPQGLDRRDQEAALRVRAHPRGDDRRRLPGHHAGGPVRRVSRRRPRSSRAEPTRASRTATRPPSKPWAARARRPSRRASRRTTSRASG